MPEPIKLYLVVRQSLNMSGGKVAAQCANAVQHILFKYFTIQVIAAKTHNALLAQDPHLRDTTQWMTDHSPKEIIQADDTVWEELKANFSLGKEIFLIKDAENETVLIFWPTPISKVPTSIINLPPLE